MTRFFSCYLIFACLPVLASAQQAPPELRGVWITTLANLDWPSSSSSDAHAQRREFCEILDKLKALNFNAVFVQVRPSGDAFYHSPFEPWSEWLTGKQGVPPTPYYDPMQFMIDECHQRGMEFHAWFNLFRAVSHIRFSKLDENNYAGCYPDQVYLTGKSLWYDPGRPEVRQRIVSIVSDVVHRYAVDGIHFDDYFYPYGNDCPDFDSLTFRKYGGAYTDMGDWRRNNLNLLIKAVSDTIKNIKPYVVFGVSPHCVWRNKNKDSTGSASGNSLGSYDKLYADTKKWFTEGWLDYIAPQLYRSTAESVADFETLLRWWTSLKAPGKVLVGHALYKTEAGQRADWSAKGEIPTQIRLSREQGSAGSIFFRLSNLLHNPAHVTDSLRLVYYALPAAVPVLVASAPLPPLPGKPRLHLAWEGEQVKSMCQNCDAGPGGKYIFIISDASGADEHTRIIYSREPQTVLNNLPSSPRITLQRMDGYNRPIAPEAVMEVVFCE